MKTFVFTTEELNYIKKIAKTISGVSNIKIEVTVRVAVDKSGNVVCDENGHYLESINEKVVEDQDDFMFADTNGYVSWSVMKKEIPLSKSGEFEIDLTIFNVSTGHGITNVTVNGDEKGLICVEGILGTNREYFRENNA